MIRSIPYRVDPQAGSPATWSGAWSAAQAWAASPRPNGHGTYAGLAPPTDRSRDTASGKTEASVPPQAAAVLEERLQRRVKRWHDIARELQQVNRRQSQFLARLSHELRNPLAPLMHGLQLLQRQSDQPERVSSTCTMMQRQLHHLLSLVDDLLDLERIAQGKIELQLQTLTLRELVVGAIELSEHKMREREHRLSVSLPNETVALRADPPRLTQVLVNLLNNAAKYTPPGGQIALNADRHEERVVLQVKDNGIGIAASDLPHVFELYSQVDRNLHMAQGGLGIGLALARQLAELHGGHLAADSRGRGQGSVFTIDLPICRSSSAPPRNAEPEGSPLAACGGGSRWRILVVDDNPDGADTLAGALKWSGHQTWVAYDGPSALGLARLHRPHAALVDLSMPGMDGFELARRLRAQDAALTLVAMTGWGSATDRHRCKDAGFSAHLAKPADLEQIESVLQGLIETAPNSGQPAQSAKL
jgi:signal transduction histidine kinase/ActR/RegA family two-component response regulator